VEIKISIHRFQCYLFTYMIYCVEEESEDTKGLIRICKSEKDRQHNGHAKKNKRTNKDLQNTTQITKDQARRTSLKPRMNSGFPKG
jgi:hypothetical protein